MKKSLEDKLRSAFQSGKDFGMSYVSGQGYPMDEDEYIDSLKKSEEVVEDKVSFTYSFLMRKLSWEKFCDLTGTNEWAKNEGAEFNDNDIYYVIESKAKEFNLI